MANLENPFITTYNLNKILNRPEFKCQDINVIY